MFLWLEGVDGVNGGGGGGVGRGVGCGLAPKIFKHCGVKSVVCTLLVQMGPINYFGIFGEIVLRPSKVSQLFDLYDIRRRA